MAALLFNGLSILVIAVKDLRYDSVCSRTPVSELRETGVLACFIY
jgi:hypothetical protein